MFICKCYSNMEKGLSWFKRLVVETFEIPVLVMESLCPYLQLTTLQGSDIITMALCCNFPVYQYFIEMK